MSSSHSGAREGAGRKPKYESDSETVVIRVPKAYKRGVQKIVELIDLMIAEGFTVEEINEVLDKTLKS